METGNNTALLPTVSKGGQYSAPHLLVDLWRQGAAVAGALSCRRPELRGGARARSTLLAALIFIFILRSHFWRPEHAQKLTKFCTLVRSGEKFDILWSLQKGVAKWLNGAPYKFSKSKPPALPLPEAYEI